MKLYKNQAEYIEVEANEQNIAANAAAKSKLHPFSVFTPLPETRYRNVVAGKAQEWRDSSVNSLDQWKAQAQARGWKVEV